MPEIEGKSDWRPSELPHGSLWWVSRNDEAVVMRINYIGNGCIEPYPDIFDGHTNGWLLGPTCRIGDAAEVQRLRGIIERIHGMVTYLSDPMSRDISIQCREALSPERQEAGDGE